VQDCWHDNYSGAPTDGSAWSVGCGENRRVLRGGSWNNDPEFLQSAVRISSYPENRFSDYGFRLARDLIVNTQESLKSDAVLQSTESTQMQFPNLLNAEREKAVNKVEQDYGLTVRELTEAQRNELKVKGGVRIEAAVNGASRAGLREGDVILAAINTDIASVKDLEAVLAKHDKAKPLHVLYRRGEWSQFAVIRPLN